MPGEPSFIQMRESGEQISIKKIRMRENALARSAELKQRIADYIETKDSIPAGFALKDAIEKNQRLIMAKLGATEEDWQDWRWQLRHRITNPIVLQEIIPLSTSQASEISLVGQRYRWAISPYYASLIQKPGTDCPIWRQAVPSIEEINDGGMDDPMAEEWTSPAPCVTRRYPDRLIINVTNRCATYCRHCQRRRNIGQIDHNQKRAKLQQAIDYIRAHEEIRDVLITGGDALLLGDRQIDWLLGELDQIEHVEIKRIGTRVPVTMPQRITGSLCSILERHAPIYVNTQFNHPLEVTPWAKAACDRLVKAGVVLGNQAVLLKGVNNNASVMKKLNQELLKIRVRPYYIFQAKHVSGTEHFITSIQEGLAIIEALRGYTSGMAVPTYIVNAPKGWGKIPLLPNYLMDLDDRELVLRTWEGRIIRYPNGPGHFDETNAPDVLLKVW